MKFEHLFKPLQVGNLTIKNRIVMAPMTRYRVEADGCANEQVAQHFADRASAGLIICEGGYVHTSGRLAAYVGGIITDQHVASWKKVTDAVHAKGGRIFMQLMHGGRVSHPALQDDGGAPWAPSAVLPKDDQIRTDGAEWQAAVTPRAISIPEIQLLIESYATATARAYEAGFDGVELHAGNGYLPNQFLSDGTNQRSDAYGGSVEARCRFVLETLDAMIAVRGPGFVGMKISPVTVHHDCRDSDPVATYDYLIPQIGRVPNLAYLAVQSTMDFVQPGAPLFDVFLFARERYKHTLFAAANLDRYSGEGLISSGTADAVVYGRRFVANPDLVERFRKNAQENLINWPHLATTGPVGYNDYPVLS